MDNRNIKKEMQKIMSRRDKRKEAGKAEVSAEMQAFYEIVILSMQEALSEHLGTTIPMQELEQEEFEVYLDVISKIDLPPEICAILITPNTRAIFNSQWDQMVKNVQMNSKAYTLVISHHTERSILIQVTLQGLLSIGTDVYENGTHFADYTYNSNDECLMDLSNVIWTFFTPKEKWTDDAIARYTENWFAKSIHRFDLENIPIHTEFSYLHNPQLLNLASLESVFKAIIADVPRELISMDIAIEYTNDLNRDMEFNCPEVTKQGIIENNIEECKALYDRLTVEIDQRLDILDATEGVKFPERNFNNPEYNKTFHDSAKKIYKQVTGLSCPENMPTE